MKKLILLFLLSFSLNLYAFEHYLTICAIFRDDASYLKEWIDFHVEQGVEHFYLYNNSSQDNYQDVLKPFIENGTVTLIEWPSEHNTEKQWLNIQCSAYMDCVQIIRDTSYWCAFIDTDEFLFCPKAKLANILKHYENYSGVCVNWMVYGTSNIKKIPDGEKITDHLCWRAENNNLENRYVKTIAKPRYVNACTSAHFFLYNKKYAVNEKMEKVKEGMFTKEHSSKLLRINHYRTRDENFFYNVKMPRSKNWDNTFRKKIEALNKVYDPILSSSGKGLSHIK